VLVVGRLSRKGLLGRFTPGIVARLLAEADGIGLVVGDVSGGGAARSLQEIVDPLLLPTKLLEDVGHLLVAASTVSISSGERP
jgi:hypothetical protein